jgi:hypothetical protein
MTSGSDSKALISSRRSEMVSSFDCTDAFIIGFVFGYWRLCQLDMY